MSSVYDALQRARRGGNSLIPTRRPATRVTDPDPSVAVPPRAEPTASPGAMAVPLSPLLASIRPLLDGTQGAVLHVVAATAGEGASTIAREFALLAGTNGHRHTLLIDADRANPQTARAFGRDKAQGVVEFLWSGANDFDALQQVPGTLLSVARLVGENGPPSLDADTLRETYRRVREYFELVVVDCPPVGGDVYSHLLPEATDGVVLVVQAEKTRPAVISRAKDIVQQAGGQVIGAVLNRRTNYIPDFLYKLL
ncbi:MAG TPA: CpsD/CapB family tyrosine-protein kinase [Stellaceae bacterium]|nr:CpsD/CapB family tyrosine-protein kinase [Stellaceae bacterium]